MHPATPLSAFGAVVIMGVAGSGKSSIARDVARSLAWPVIEGDDFHSLDNLRKMRKGIALTDADRAGWLDALARALCRHPGGAVLACSALKRAYRDRLRVAVPRLRFAYLDIAQELAHQRVLARAGDHLFPPSLVASQFATLEDPREEEGVLTLDASLSLPALTAGVVDWISKTEPA